MRTPPYSACAGSSWAPTPTRIAPACAASSTLARVLAVLLIVVAAAACAHGPVTDASRFESAVLTQDGRTVVFVYRVLRYRPAQGIAAFPDGGVPKYLDDRIVVGACDAAGGAPRVLTLLDNRFVHSSDRASLRVEKADPGRVLLGWSGQPSTSGPSLARWSRIDLASGRVQPLPDLVTELARRGLELGCKPFGDLRVLAPDGTLLVGTTGPDGDELQVRRPSGEWARIDAIEQFYGVHGSELYYWSRGGEAVVRDWRTLASRTIARWDPAAKITRTIVRGDPTVSAIERFHPGPGTSAGVTTNGSSVTIGTRAGDGRWTYHGIAIDLKPLRR